jgi:hypothetical protein
LRIGQVTVSRFAAYFVLTACFLTACFLTRRVENAETNAIYAMRRGEFVAGDRRDFGSQRLGRRESVETRVVIGERVAGRQIVATM